MRSAKCESEVTSERAIFLVSQITDPPLGCQVSKHQDDDSKNIQLAGYRMGLNFQVHQRASEFNESYDIFLDLYGDVG